MVPEVYCQKGTRSKGACLIGSMFKKAKMEAMSTTLNGSDNRIVSGRRLMINVCGRLMNFFMKHN